MRAVLAILVDAYRELSSRKIFWLTLLLSLLLVVGYASIGFTETGVSILFGLYEIESELINADGPLAPVLYKGIFVSFIVSLWLAWAAAILALISTASIFPDLVARGSIDLILSKPVSRVTVFATKYAAGLLFALLQVSIVCVGVFLALGWRLGEWDPMIFAAIPIVVVFFSYLFSISALVGIISRSSITALLMAILFWFMLFSVQAAEAILLDVKINSEVRLEQHEENVQRLTERAGDDSADDAARRSVEPDLAVAERVIEEEETFLSRINPWHRGLQLILLPLPKTGQTIGLLDRWLVREGDIGLQEIFGGNVRYNNEGEIVPIRSDTNESQRRMREQYDERSLWHVIGTSMLFEFVVLLLACWVFVRRDY